MVTLDAIRQGAAPEIYPRHLLVGCESALVLFAAAFHGQQDAVWMAEADMSATCVDLDETRLAEMASMYPSDWAYVTADVFDFAFAAQDRWSVVSLDPPTNLFDRCAELLPVWCLLARKAVILGCGETTDVRAPEGWHVTERLRRSSFNGGVYWAVIRKLTDPLAEGWVP